MAANTALVVRQPVVRAAPRRRARTNNGITSKPTVITGRQVFMSVLGGITSAGAAAVLVNVAHMRPVTAGATVGIVGGLGAAFSTGADMRPFAAGAAVAGAGITGAAWLGHFQRVQLLTPEEVKKAEEAKKEAAKKDAANAANNASLPPPQRPELVAGVPPNAQNGNPAGAAAPPAPRQASNVTADMRAQIQRAMAQTNFRPRY